MFHYFEESNLLYMGGKSPTGEGLGQTYHVQIKLKVKDRETKIGKGNQMLRGLWHIRNVQIFCVQMKSNQLFRFRNLFLLVFISRMNL